MGVIGGTKSLIGVNISLGWQIFLLSDKDISTCLVVMNVVVIGVVVLGMEVGDEVVCDVVVKKRIRK